MQPDAAAQAVRTALDAARTAEDAGDLDRALGYFRALAEIQPNNRQWPFEAIRVLRKSGREGEALQALRAALRRWPRALELPEIKAILPEAERTGDGAIRALGEHCPGDAELKRPPISDDGAKDFNIALGGRKTAVIVFTGLADRMVMPLPIFDRYLAALDLTAIYLRDKRRIGFFNGVSALSDDYEGTIAVLQSLLQEKGVETVHTLGNSAGGMAALSYGIDLGAKTVLTFSAPLALVAGTKEVDFRTAVFADRLLHGVPEERRDFRQRLAAASSPPEAHLYYGSEMPEDTYHATFLRGQPGVRLHPLTGLAGHGALFRLAMNGDLRPILENLYGVAD